MNLSNAPNLPLARRRVGCGVASEVGQQNAQIKPLVESAGKGAQVLPCVLAELEVPVLSSNNRGCPPCVDN